MVAQTEDAGRFREKNALSSQRLIDHQYQLLSLTTDRGSVDSFLASLVRGGTVVPPTPQGTVVPSSSSANIIGVYDAWAKRLIEQHRVLGEIARSLHRLHDEDTLRLRDEAQAALRNGMSATGRDRQEDFRDALNLLRGVQTEIAGGRNYAIWFEIGWLHWQMGNLTEAEEAFYQTNRLSKAANNAFYSYALRHLAYVQYLQGRHEQAHITIQRAHNAAPEDSDICYDAARYAAVNGKQTEAVSLLEASITLNPALLPLSEHEEDFATLGAEISTRLDSAVTLGLRLIAEEKERLHKALAAIKEAEQRIGQSLPFSTDISREDMVVTRSGKAQREDYFTIATAYQEIMGKADAALAAGTRALEAVIAAAEAEVDRPRRQIAKLHQDRTMWEQTLKTLEEEARQSGFPLHFTSGLTALRLRIQKRDKQADSVRISYQNCQHNLEAVTLQISEATPPLEKAVAEAEKRVVPLRETLAWFRSLKI